MFTLGCHENLATYDLVWLGMGQFDILSVNSRQNYILKYQISGGKTLCWIQVNTAPKRQFTKDEINMEGLYSISIIKLCFKFQDLTKL